MASTPIHLLVLIHGMWGNPDHLAEMARVYRERRASDSSPEGEQLHVLVAQTNSEEFTYDGIDWGSERVAEEIMAEIKHLEGEGKKITRFSVTGYSLGGLVSRYLIGVLYQRKFFDNITPMNFTTIATPHIGIPRLPTLISSISNFLGPRLLSRTGEQFFLADKWSEKGRPLLAVMADPDCIFFKALSLFPHIVFYGNAVNDLAVPYTTALVELENPFADHEYNGMKIELDEDYSPIIKSYTPAIASFSKPKLFSRAWFKQPSRPLLTPELSFSFPYNIMLYILLPVVVPTFLGLVVIPLSKASRSSRSRLRILEKDESNTQRLVHIFAQLERDMEEAAMESVDDPGAASLGLPSSQNTLSTPPAETKSQTSPMEKQPSEPMVMTPLQRELVNRLNTLPNLDKKRAFIHPARDSHAVIVCRDVVRFKSHKTGEGVLRHLADHFVL